MSKVPVDKLKPIAAMLGANGADWAIERLHNYADVVGCPIKAPDDKWYRKAYEGALNLQMWLMIEDKVYDKLGQECPVEIEDIGTPLAELLPLIARYIRQPGKRGGPAVDWRKHICASVCASIWEEFHPTAGSNSDTLLKACEDYWQACGQPPTPADKSGHLRNWKWFLASNSPKTSEVR